MSDVPPPVEVADRIWIGGDPDAVAVATLHGQGITHILNVSTEPENPAVGLTIRVEWVPTIDDFRPKPISWFRRGVAFADRVLNNPSQKLYVHCREGRHRAPLMTYVILRALRGLSPLEARRAISAKRPVAEFPPAYLDSAETYLRKESHGSAQERDG
jgi:protein-tyrosine phosphatase